MRDKVEEVEERGPLCKGESCSPASPASSIAGDEIEVMSDLRSKSYGEISLGGIRFHHGPS